MLSRPEDLCGNILVELVGVVTDAYDVTHVVQVLWDDMEGGMGIIVL